MLGQQKLKQIAEMVLGLSKADETEVLLSVSESGLTRFANSQIHQNVAWHSIGISVRVVLGKRIGVASTNNFSDESLRSLVERATALAKLQKEDPFFVSLPKPSKLPDVKDEVFPCSEADRATAVNTIIQKAKSHSITASGAYAADISELAVANSHGVWAYHAGSSCNLSTILLGATSTGFASDIARKPSEINAEMVADTAVEKVLTSANPTDIEPGEYEVVLEPQAVSEMMAFFSFYGPNARIYHEQASFFSGKLGQKVVGENVTIIDDPLHPQIFPMPFDFEGQPKAKLEIIKNGVLTNLVYDSYYANRYKTANTGHALPAPNTMGPIPLHAYIAPGDKTKEQMITSIKKGILVTRLWYVRVLNPRYLSITGMTRDGTFLIEDGKIVRAVKNLRFNQSIPEAFNNVIAIENKLTPIASVEGEMINLMPTTHIKGWHFTSRTLF